MRLHRLRLEHVRGVDHAEVDLAYDGVTVVCAPNESGKTTLIDALDILLEVKDSSNAARVRELQPVGRDVGSTIEVELSCGSFHLTCTKTFNKGRRTELVIHAPVADKLTGSAAHDRLREIVEAEADLALFSALRFEQGRDLAAVGLGGSRVLADRLDAVAGGGGAAAGDALFERADQERLRYVTATGRDGKVLTSADEHVEHLASALADATERLAAVERDSAEFARLQTELPTLERRRDQELVPRVQELRQQLAEVRTSAERLATRTAERDRSRGALEAARRDLRDREERAEMVAELAAQVEGLAVELAPLEERCDTLQTRRTDAAEQVAEAERSVEGARQARDQAELQLDLVLAIEDRDRLRDRHDHLEDLRKQARAAEQALASIALDADGLAAIRAAERERHAQQAALDAGSPRVAVQPRRALLVQVDEQEQHLDPQAGWEGTVTGRLTLDLPEVARVTVDASGATEDLQRGVAQAQARLAEACRRGGVADPEEAEEVGEQRTEHLATLRRREEMLQQAQGDADEQLLVDQLATAEDRVARLSAQVGDIAALPDAAAARVARDQARSEATEAEDRLEERRAAHAAIAEELQGLRERGAAQRADLVQRGEQLDRERRRLDTARQDQDDQTLAAELGAAEEELAAAEDALDAAEERHAALQPEAVEALAETVDKRLEDTGRRIAELRERREGLRTRLELAGDEGLAQRVAEVEEQLTPAQRDRDRLRARARAAITLFEALREAREEAYRAYRDPLRERIVAQARLLYGTNDVDVELGDELEVVRRHLDGVSLSWDQLSAGAREQLGILSGLAAARIAGEDGVPFVLDDTLGYTDPVRLERLGALLSRLTDVQVIVLTCDPDRFQYVGGARLARLDELRAATV